MFLVRMTFWLAVVVMLLPAEPERQSEGGDAQAVSVGKAVDAASVAVSDMAGFCDRNREACDTGAALWSLFLRKAEYGARKVYELAAGRDPATVGDDRPGPKVREAAHQGDRDMAPVDTLRDSDREPAWLGPDVNDI